MAQLVLLAVSAKDERDVRMIRVWTVTAVTPAARIVEWMRGGGNGFLRNYVLLHDTNRENRRLQADLEARGIQTRPIFAGNILRQPGFAAIDLEAGWSRPGQPGVNPGAGACRRAGRIR